MDKFVIRKGAPTSAEAVPSTSNANTVPVISSGKTKSGDSEQKSVTGPGRSFQEHWVKVYPWITYDAEKRKAFCSVCQEAARLGVNLNKQSVRDQRAVSAFVEMGFSTWNKALERFKIHEQSDLHRGAVLGLSNIKKGVNVLASISKGKAEDMKAARKCLLNIISTINFLAKQGLALRGHTETSSNFTQLLLLRSEDVPELKSWLSRSKFKWTSHEIQNEILNLLSQETLDPIIKKVKSSKHFAIIVDETTDVSIKEQMSLCLRTVDENLEISEDFLGLYELQSTSAESIFNLINEILAKYEIDMKNCRGQCFDGAANMSGEISGVQARFKNVEARALYVHCSAHTINLVVQDAFQKISEVRDFLAIIKDLINFIRRSPKRLNLFKCLQSEDGSSQSLRPFCPTRWCLRVTALKSIMNNFLQMLTFFKNISEEASETGAKAAGFVATLEQFQTVFFLSTLIFVFERVEVLNAELQKPSLNFFESKIKIIAIKESLQNIRSNEREFSDFWANILLKGQTLGVSGPELPRQRKIPKKLDENAGTSHVFLNAESFYKRKFYEILDQTICSLSTRFQSSLLEHLIEMEKFATQKVAAEKVCDFYGCDFDPERLLLHRNMFLDFVQTLNSQVNSVPDVLRFFKNNQNIVSMLPEYVKFIKLLLTIPVTSCTAERSFSGLRRLKTYLRSTMTSDRLNSMAILNVHKEEAGELDLDSLADKFISRSSVRRNTFFSENQSCES